MSWSTTPVRGPAPAVAVDSAAGSTHGDVVHPDPVELRDVCSLVSLADRVLLVSPAADSTVTRLLGVVLEDLGFHAQVVTAATVHLVRPCDTVVAVCAAEVDPVFIRLLRPVLVARAVLLVVTVSARSALLPLADAAITLPTLSGGGPLAGQPSPSMGLDLRLVVAVDAIHRDLERRRSTPL